MTFECGTVSPDDLIRFVSLTERASTLLGAQTSSVSTCAGVCFEYRDRADGPLSLSFKPSLNTSMDSGIAYNLLKHFPAVSWMCCSSSERQSKSQTVTEYEAWLAPASDRVFRLALPQDVD
jgi:hypothetical protein